jgi:hypothetical protein
MDRKTKGRLAESYATIWFVENGYEVFLPAHGNTKYDLLVTKGAEVSRVSVKACGYKSSKNRWCVTMRQTSRRANNQIHYDMFNHSEYEFVAVWLYEENRIVVVPSSQVSENGDYLYIPILEDEADRRAVPPC